MTPLEQALREAVEAADWLRGKPTVPMTAEKQAALTKCVKLIGDHADELLAAYAEKGMVVVTFDDADSLRCYYAEEAENTIKPGRKEWLLEQSKRLEAALKEAQSKVCRAVRTAAIKEAP